MNITGKHGEYECRYRLYGWTGAEVVIYSPRKFLWFRRKLTSNGPTGISFATVERMRPERLREWFQEAVDEYEDYTDAWKAVQR